MLSSNSTLFIFLYSLRHTFKPENHDKVQIPASILFFPETVLLTRGYLEDNNTSATDGELQVS